MQTRWGSEWKRTLHSSGHCVGAINSSLSQSALLVLQLKVDMLVLLRRSEGKGRYDHRAKLHTPTYVVSASCLKDFAVPRLFSRLASTQLSETCRLCVSH